MKIFVLANQKGGVGKTTYGRHLAFAAAERKLKTLVTDFDPQSNTSKTLLHLAKQEIIDQGGWLTTSGMFDPKNKAVPMPVNDYFSLIAADADLVDVGDFSLNVMINPRKALAKFAKDYDVCIIDTPPSRGKLLFAALSCADYVISPCTLDEDATDGLAALFEDIERVRQMEWNPDIQVMGIQINKMDRNSAHDRNALKELREEVGDLVLENILYDRAATRLAIRRPVWRGNRGENKGAAAIEMKTACNAVFENAGL
ncbi:MAG TPA: ParA family protein [Noviherbaspirillum sp.]|nr:ParA family protein [Noviherbaspirillum sp.]